MCDDSFVNGSISREIHKCLMKVTLACCCICSLSNVLWWLCFHTQSQASFIQSHSRGHGDSENQFYFIHEGVHTYTHLFTYRSVVAQQCGFVFILSLCGQYPNFLSISHFFGRRWDFLFLYYAYFRLLQLIFHSD